MQTFTLIFLAALALTTFAKLWLAYRHMRHIRAHRQEVPAAFAGQVSLEAHQKAADYSVAKTRLGTVSIALEAGLLLALTLGGGLQYLDDIGRTLLGNGLLQGMALIIGVTVIGNLLELPVNLYRIFGIEQQFGFNKMTVGMFIADTLKQTLLAALLGLPLLAVVLWLMGRMGDAWWIYVWIVWISFNLLVLAIYPTFIAPLFNKFTPLAEPDLKRRIESFLERCGFKAEGLFVMDGSKRSSHGNAYFTGFGKGKRIVFFDTLLSHLSHDEIEAVLAHELGHFKRHHIFKRIVWMFAISLGFLWLLDQLMQASWFYSGLGVSSHTTAMTLTLFFLVVPVFSFLLLPLASRYSRQHEFEADEFAARHASAQDLVRALVKLYKDNAATLTPDPLHAAVYDSHPSAGLRIARLQNAVHNNS